VSNKKLYMVFVHGEEHPHTLDVYDKVEDAQHRANELELEATASGQDIWYGAKAVSVEEASKLLAS
jgi:hypothetical protein